MDFKAHRYGVSRLAKVTSRGMLEYVMEATQALSPSAREPSTLEVHDHV